MGLGVRDLQRSLRAKWASELSQGELREKRAHERRGAERARATVAEGNAFTSFAWALVYYTHFVVCNSLFSSEKGEIGREEPPK